MCTSKNKDTPNISHNEGPTPQDKHDRAQNRFQLMGCAGVMAEPLCATPTAYKR